MEGRKQCEQIGRFLIDLGDNFSYKTFGDFLGYFEKMFLKLILLLLDFEQVL